MRSSTVPARVSRRRMRRPVAVSVALDAAGGALLAIGRTCHGADLKLHQAFGGEADHLTQKIGVRGLLDGVPQVIMSTVIGGFSGQVGVRNQTLRQTVGDHLSQDLHHPAKHHRGRLEVRVEPDAVGRVDVDRLDLAAQPLAFRHRRHDLERVAEDHAIRPAAGLELHLRLAVLLGQAEVAEEVGGAVAPVPEVVDQRLGVDVRLPGPRPSCSSEGSGLFLERLARDVGRKEGEVDRSED